MNTVTGLAAVALPQQVLPASMTHCWCLELGRHTVPTPRQMFLMPRLFVPTRFTLNIRFPTRNLQLLGTGVSLPSSRQALWVLGLRNFLAEDTSQVSPSLQLEIASAVSDATVGSMLLASSKPHPKYFCYSLFRIFMRTNRSQGNTAC